MSTRSAPASAVSYPGGFLTGVGLLVRGVRMYAANPRLALLGVVPALITGVLFLGAFLTLAYFAGDVAAVLTPFADDWSGSTRTFVRFAAGLALLGLAALIGVIAFTAVTLAIGGPFYERISERVEEQYGAVPNPVEVGWARSLRRGVTDSSRLVARSVMVGVPLFVAGFLPVVGQTAVPVLGAVLGGWLLAVELVGTPFERRGMGLAERRRALRRIRPVTAGFGVAVFVVFLIPLGAVVFTPAAVAGATLLARRALGEPTERRRS
ncbi:EI24 domain-containing protein [Actinopolymorpha singaporensis]|uniref:EI24 domain-containing protein n=1 Tax=Actinopolymorpha singaporensis TaxID=117157 RepID=UPI0018D3A17F|nr:EI24 domain-containing protein [Actinopolymorpha singaporensis]